MAWKQYQGFYVYTYFDGNNTPYYVGMGQKKRMIQKHLYVAVPVLENIKVIDKLTQQEAWDKEIELIAQYGREHLGTGPLKNLTPGGPTQKSGWAQSKEARLKISLGNSGKIRTEIHKQNYRKPKTAEHANKIRLANLGRKDDGRSKKGAATVDYKIANDAEYAERVQAMRQKQSKDRQGKPWGLARREAHMRRHNNTGVLV